MKIAACNWFSLQRQGCAYKSWAAQTKYLSNHLQVQVDDKIIFFDLGSVSCSAVRVIENVTALYGPEYFVETGAELSSIDRRLLRVKAQNQEFDVSDQTLSLAQHAINNGHVLIETIKSEGGKQKLTKVYKRSRHLEHMLETQLQQRQKSKNHDTSDIIANIVQLMVKSENIFRIFVEDFKVLESIHSHWQSQDPSKAMNDEERATLDAELVRLGCILNSRKIEILP